MKELFIKISLVALFLAVALPVGYRNVGNVKAHANETWDAAGFTVVGYEGYQWGGWHGGDVWYIVKKKEDNGVLYHGHICKWGDEYHIYNLSALDAIKP